MKVLMISGDKNALAPGTGAFERLLLQKKVVEQLDVFVWPQVHSIWQIWQAARKERYDVITAQDPFWRGLLASRVAHKNGANLNLQVHADLSAEPWLRRILARRVLRHADSIRVVSQKLKEQVVAYGIKAPITVLPIFIDIDRFKKIAHEPHENPTVLWVGRFEEEKDPLCAINVFRAVQENLPATQFVMLGEGTLKKKLMQAAKHLPVEFPGWSNPLAFLSQADVVLSTSRQESFGASIVEALAAGIPVVAPDVGIAAEAGAVVVPRDQLANAVIAALQSNVSGELKLQLLSAQLWVQRWKEALI